MRFSCRLGTEKCKSYTAKPAVKVTKVYALREFISHKKDIRLNLRCPITISAQHLSHRRLTNLGQLSWKLYCILLKQLLHTLSESDILRIAFIEESIAFLQSLHLLTNQTSESVTEQGTCSDQWIGLITLTLPLFGVSLIMPGNRSISSTDSYVSEKALNYSVERQWFYQVSYRMASPSIVSPRSKKVFARRSPHNSLYSKIVPTNWKKAETCSDCKRELHGLLPFGCSQQEGPIQSEDLLTSGRDDYEGQRRRDDRTPFWN